MNIVILGGGLSGLSAAYHLNKLGIACILVEKEKNVGGLCRTYHNKDGFVFDKTLHLLHTKTKYVESLILKMLKNETIRCRRIAKVLIDEDLIPYPFQSYFYLSKNDSLIKECIYGLENFSKVESKALIENFEDYVYRKFGKGIAHHFMVPYNTKLWTVPLKELSYDWAKRFVPTPNPSEILNMYERYKQLSSLEIRDWGYNAEFFYFKKGGIQNIANSLVQNLSNTQICLSCEVTNVDLKEKKIELNNLEELYYDIVISTIPLPELIEKTKHTPSSVKLARNRLRHTSVYNINLGFSQEIIKDIHWLYVPNPKLSFFRLGFPHNLSPFMTPPGCSSISVEVAYSKDKPVNSNSIYEKIVSDLVRIHLMNSKNDIIFRKDFDLEYAYVIPDSNYFSSRRTIIRWLAKNSILPIGRYGAWQYSSMEDAIIEGKRIASKIGRSLQIK